MKRPREISILLESVEEAFHKRAWHGTNLRGSIRGMSAQEAAWRFAPKRHNVWEIVMHCAYWKYIVRRRITGEKRGSFPLKGNNFFRRPEGKPSEDAWRRDIKLIEDTHRRLVELIGNLSSSDLTKIPSGSKFDNRMIIFGIAAHDVYHTGQIQLIKRMMK